MSKSEHAKRRNRERSVARKLVHNHIGTDVFLAAQNWTCPICGGLLEDKRGAPGTGEQDGDTLTIDHVYHLDGSGRQHGNLLLAHRECNMFKDDRLPTCAEQRMLGTVNRCLGYRKGIYKACRIGKGVNPYGPNGDKVRYSIDPYIFAVSLYELLLKKVFIR